jgi:beta-lactamase regulating signal transducer with metallopeptidase domain
MNLPVLGHYLSKFPQLPWLADASLRISIVLGLFLLLRPILRRAIGSSWLAALWLIVLVRLLAPWPIESRWSLSPNGEKQEMVATKSGWQVRTHVSDTSSGSAPPASPLGNHSVPAKTIPWFGLWLSGTAIGFALLVVRMWRTRRLYAHTVPASNPRLLASFESIPAGWRRGIDLRETDALAVPTLAGLWRRQIWMPRAWIDRLSGDALRHVLVHELGHASRHDLLVQWLFSVATCVHWFNPLVWFAARSAQADREMACDAWVLARGGETSPGDYATTLLSCIALLRRPASLAPTVIAMAVSKRGLFNRIATLAQFHVRPAWCGVLGLAVLLGAVVTLTTSPVAAQASGAAASKPAPVAPSQSTPASPGTVAPAPAATLSFTKSAAEPAAPAKPVQSALQVEVAARFIEITDSAGRQLASQDSFFATLFGSRVSATGAIVNNAGSTAGSSGPSMMGVRTEQEFTATVRLLNETRGADVLNAPRVTTKSGQRAVIEIIREFRYPTEFTPDQKTPPTLIPSAFETRNVGVTLEVNPTVSPDRRGIDLEVVPQVVELTGFNRLGPGGSTTLVKVPRGAVPDVKAGPGEILQPIFSSRKITTNVAIFDGQTIVLGNLRKDDEVDEDGKPIEPRQLLIFITAQIVDPSVPVRSEPPVAPAVTSSAITPTIPGSEAKPAGESAPVGIPAPGKPGFVTSPHAPSAGYIDVRGFPSGTEVKCPYTGKIFRTP